MTVKNQTTQYLPCPVCGNECRADIVLRYEESRQAAAQGREALEPVAWRYELAHSIYQTAKDYADWRWHLSETKPNVPEGSIRNLTPLYAAPPPQVDSGRGPTAEDIYACAESTLIGFRDELTEDQIRFICDQISRKATMAERSGGRG